MALDTPRRSLPRLDASCYQADAAVIWTLPVQKRATGWLTEGFHFQWRETLLHTVARHLLVCPLYTLMPDHIHLVWIGTSPDSDQRTAMAFLRTHVEPLLGPARFQHQAHDHVLTKEERTRNGLLRVCEYILLNPVRANLAKQTHEWAYSGCMFAGYAGANPFQEAYWDWFWKLFYKLRDPECDKHVSVRKVI